MSIRSSLLAVTISLGVIISVTVGLVGVLNLNRNIKREAQQRVNHDLKIASAEYHDRLNSLSRNLSEQAKTLQPFTAAKDINRELRSLKERFDLTVLNICSVEGTPLFGSYSEEENQVPVGADPVLRGALLGNVASGTLLLDSKRLLLEGGVPLQKASVVYRTNQTKEPAAESALFWWTAIPLYDSDGRITALLYGGRMLNYDFELVDRLQNLIFGNDLYNGKPVGTVTIFLKSIRVATNVRGPDNNRAVGTKVSREVERKVLEEGEIWNDRALVVDAWYISAYQPISEPDGTIIGMLYVGLLEAPYLEIGRDVAVRLFWPALLLLAIAVAVSLFLIRRITRPLEQLSESAAHLREANRGYRFQTDSNFREIEQLRGALNEMQSAIAGRDKSLQEKIEELNCINRNYMEMLGFITHELKSPMAAAQQMINVVLDGFIGDMPEKAEDMLERIRRALEQSQDMVKNYLDLSRVERGELEADKTDINVFEEVVEPVVDQTSQLFHWKGIALDVTCPRGLNITADPELLKIALTNYLNNAAKYGRNGGKARLEVKEREERLEFSVWNEGDGFTEEEGKNLFQKFSRLRNNASRGSRGSGLGLFLCKHIARLHDGEVDAESELGKWARFVLRIPKNDPKAR